MDFPATQLCEDDICPTMKITSDDDGNVQVGILTINSVNHPIHRGINKIGRHPSCNIVLNDITVSKYHAEIEAGLSPGWTFVCDLNSSNKTRINKEILRPQQCYPLKDGDVIQLGKVLAVYAVSNLNRTVVPETPVPCILKNRQFIVHSTPHSTLEESTLQNENAKRTSESLASEKEKRLSRYSADASGSENMKNFEVLDEQDETATEIQKILECNGRRRDDTQEERTQEIVVNKKEDEAETKSYDTDTMVTQKDGENREPNTPNNLQDVKTGEEDSIHSKETLRLDGGAVKDDGNGDCDNCNNSSETNRNTKSPNILENCANEYIHFGIMPADRSGSKDLSAMKKHEKNANETVEDDSIFDACTQLADHSSRAEIANSDSETDEEGIFQDQYNNMRSTNRSTSRLASRNFDHSMKDKERTVKNAKEVSESNSSAESIDLFEMVTQRNPVETQMDGKNSTPRASRENEGFTESIFSALTQPAMDGVRHKEAVVNNAGNENDNIDMMPTQIARKDQSADRKSCTAEVSSDKEETAVDASDDMMQTQLAEPLGNYDDKVKDDLVTCSAPATNENMQHSNVASMEIDNATSTRIANESQTSTATEDSLIEEKSRAEINPTIVVVIPETVDTQYLLADSDSSTDKNLDYEMAPTQLFDEVENEKRTTDLPANKKAQESKSGNVLQKSQTEDKATPKTDAVMSSKCSTDNKNQPQSPTIRSVRRKRTRKSNLANIDNDEDSQDKRPSRLRKCRLTLNPNSSSEQENNSPDVETVLASSTYFGDCKESAQELNDSDEDLLAGLPAVTIYGTAKTPGRPPSTSTVKSTKRSVKASATRTRSRANKSMPMTIKSDDELFKKMNSPKCVRYTTTDIPSENDSSNSSKKRKITDTEEVALSEVNVKSKRRTTKSMIDVPASPSSVKCKVLFTGLQDNDYAKVVKHLGGSKVEDPARCTVLVTDKVRRTAKFLCALAQGVPIVSVEWLKESQSVGRFLDWEGHFLKDPVAEAKFGFKLRKSLDKAKQRKLLDGFTVILTRNISSPPVTELKSMVASCGGKALIRPPAKWANKSVIVTSEEDLDNAKKMLSKAPKTATVQSTEFILMGILRQELDFNKYKFD